MTGFDIAVRAVRDKGLDPETDPVAGTDCPRSVARQLNDLRRKGKLEKFGSGRDTIEVSERKVAPFAMLDRIHMQRAILMAIFVQPVIDQQDHDVFWRIFDPRLPETYDEWLYLCAKKPADFAGRDHTVRQIEIKPEELLAHCRTTRNLEGLWNFATENVGLVG